MDNSFGPAVCRICMCGETSIPYNGKQAGEPLISPCKCSGTMGLYHRSCLEHWLTVSNTKNCEICKFQFKLGVKIQSFFDYLRKIGFRKPPVGSDARNPIIDFAFTIIITPIAIFALMLCVRGARAAGKRYHGAYEKRYDADERTRLTDTLNESSMEFALFVFISVIIFFSLSTFLIIMLVNHYTQFKKWQRKYKIFFVIDQLDLERSLQYNPHWRSQYTITSKISNTFRRLRGSSIFKDSVIETARSEGVQAESILGNNLPTTVIVMSQNALQEDIAMSSLMSPQFVNRCVSSTPQMVGSIPPQNFGLSPISLNDFYPSRFVEDQGIRKSQSVYSVCSFGNGVMVCSTPVNERIFTTSDPAFRMSTPDPIEEEPFEVKGRFQVERLDTPTKKM